MNEKTKMDRKNLGKIALKTGLAFSGLNFVNITGVFKPTWNTMNPIVSPFINRETNSYMSWPS